MTDVKAIEDLTLDEIKEQLAIYQRFYYHKKKQEKQYWEAKKRSAEQAVKRQILNKILEDNDKGIKIDDLNLEELDKKKKKGRKVIPVERAVMLKNVKVEKEEVKEEVKEEEEVKEVKTPIKKTRVKKAKKEEQ